MVAHLGWLNFLKESITQQGGIVEFASSRSLAHGSGECLCQRHDGGKGPTASANLEEAKTHFATASKSGRAKAFVRGCQLEGMIYNDEPGVQAELIRVANQMRKDNDSISDDDKGRIHVNFNMVVGTNSELREVVSAVPHDEARARTSGSTRRAKRYLFPTAGSGASSGPTSTKSPARRRRPSRLTGALRKN